MQVQQVPLTAVTQAAEMLLPLVVSAYKVHRGSESYCTAAFAKVGDLLPGCAPASKLEKECICGEGEFELQPRNNHN